MHKHNQDVVNGTSGIVLECLNQSEKLPKSDSIFTFKNIQ